MFPLTISEIVDILSKKYPRTDIFNSLTQLVPNGEYSVVLLLLHIDRVGDFRKKRGVVNETAKLIFEAMPRSSQFEILTYIEYNK